MKLFALKLHKSTLHWWDHTKKQHVKDRKSNIETWAKMKKLMQTKFLPANHRQESFLEYHNLSLRIPYVEDFIAKIDWLQMRCVVDEDEEPVIT